MKTEAEIRAAGMRALIQALGTVEAEQFVAALTRDRFDYTEWRKTGLPDLDLETLSAQAAQYSRTLDNRREVPESIRQELAALAAKPEHDIDFSDLPATTAPDWQGARRGPFYRPVKQPLTVRIDADGLEWLKSQGKGYQRGLNAILRSAMLDQKS